MTYLGRCSSALVCLLAALLGSYGCGGGGSDSGSSVPQGNVAVKDQAVTSVQALSGGLNFPFMALRTTAPPGLVFNGVAANTVRPHTLQYNPSLNLYFSLSTSGNKDTINLFKDSAGKQSAGSLSMVAVGQAATGTYTKYPVTIQMTADITAGNLPMTGNGQIVFQDATGKNTMTGTINLPVNSTTMQIAMTLDDTKKVGGTLVVVQNGMTSTVTNLVGDLNSITGDATVAPQGWTGTATFSILKGSFTEKLNVPGGKTITAGLNSSGGLDIGYPDGGTETVPNPIALKLGSGGGSSVTNPTITIAWPARSRALSGPTSALSATLAFASGSTSGGSFETYVNRNSNTAAHTETYPIPGTFNIGSDPLAVSFYAQADTQGAVVATASATATFSTNGVSAANIVLNGTITKVAVTTTTLTVGQAPGLLQFSATDASNNAVAVSPGSAFWTLVSGNTFLTLAPDGTATPLAAGSPVVKVTVDGVVSTPATVLVKANTAAYQPPVAIPGPNGYVIYRVLPTGQMVGTAGSSALYWSSPTAQPVPLKGVSGSTGDVAQGAAIVAGKLVIVGSSGGYPAVWTSTTSAPKPLDSSVNGTANGPLPGSATSINALGQIVGLLDSYSGSTYWSSPTAPVQLMPGSQGGTASDPSAGSEAYLADTGQIGFFTQVGRPGFPVATRSKYSASGVLVPALTTYGNGTRSDLGRYMNAAGLIVGVDTKTIGVTPSQAVYWMKSEGYSKEHFLPSLMGGTDSEAIGIGENGWIVGTSGGGQNAVLWKTANAVVDIGTLLPANSGWALTEGDFVLSDGSIIGKARLGSQYYQVYIKAHP